MPKKAKENDLAIVESLPSLYPLKSFEADAVQRVVMSRNVGGWIPVEERLPDEEEYLKNDGMFIVSDGNYVYETMFDICNSRFHEDYFSITPSRDACIIAWQPLPIIYKPSAQETS